MADDAVRTIEAYPLPQWPYASFLGRPSHVHAVICNDTPDSRDTSHLAFDLAFAFIFLFWRWFTRPSATHFPVEERLQPVLCHRPQSSRIALWSYD